MTVDLEKTESDGQDTAEGAGEQESLTLMQMIFSGLAAGLGVQSSANRKRDFSRGKASHFIVLGIVFTVLFVIGMVTFVQMVLSTAG